MKELEPRKSYAIGYMNGTMIVCGPLFVLMFLWSIHSLQISWMAYSVIPEAFFLLAMTLKRELYPETEQPK